MRTGNYVKLLVGSTYKWPTWSSSHIRFDLNINKKKQNYKIYKKYLGKK